MISAMIKNKCGICDEVAIEPVCAKCYTRELIYWLRENIVNKLIMRYILQETAERVSSRQLTRDYCVLCHRPSVFVCSDCYFSTVKRILQEINMSNKVIREFSEIFRGAYHIQTANKKINLSRKYVQV